MPIYRKFERQDLAYSTVHTTPRTSVAYNHYGWRGTAGPSGSLSLYEGVRGRSDVSAGNFGNSGLAVYPLDPVDTHSIDRVTFISGSYPATGSIRYVRCTDTAADNFQDVTDTRWYDGHFRAISNLYDYHSKTNPEYFLGTYDHYAILLATYFDAPEGYQGGAFVFSGSLTNITSSFTAEAWIKTAKDPLAATDDTSGWYPTIFSQGTSWQFGVINDVLYFTTSSLSTISTGSVSIPKGVWSHVAVVVSGTSGSFVVNGVATDQFPVGALNLTSSGPLVVGSAVSPTGPLNNSFNGFLFESRIWNVPRTVAQISASYMGLILDSGSQPTLVHYARFNDGPLSTAHGFSAGSGAFDYSMYAHHGAAYGHAPIFSNGAFKPHWEPNDNPSFRTVKKKINTDLSEIRVIHVPSMFYGRQIASGSVRLMLGDYNTMKVVRTLVDDGRGRLYVSGSMTRDLSGEEYTGQSWRSVGNVFYGEGLIVLTDPSLRNSFNTSGSLLWDGTVTGSFQDLLSLDFKGHNRICTKTFMCRMGPAQFNASNNPTYTFVDDLGTLDPGDDRLSLRSEDPVTYVTAIGIYNEERKLIAVAKLAQPIRKREVDKLDIRLRMDF